MNLKWQTIQRLYPNPVSLVSGPVALLCCGCPRDPIVSRLGSWAPAVLIPCVSCQPCCQSASQVQQPSTMTPQQAQVVAEQQAAQLAQQAQHLAQEQTAKVMQQLAQNHAQQLVSMPGTNPGQMSVPPAQLTLFHNNFQLLLNVDGFLPHELHVSVKDDFVEVSAERLDTQHTMSALSSQSFLRRYKLPHSVDGNLTQCNISSDGILHISAPWRI